MVLHSITGHAALDAVSTCKEIVGHAHNDTSDDIMKRLY